MTAPLAASPAATRLGWLDVLRGWAALVVAVHHASYVYVPELQRFLAGWFDLGRYGVLVFFLVSGYIVPASLERRGSVRAFWIGRFFRIYPMLAVACLLAVLPFLLGVRGLRAGLEQYSPVTAVLAHATMMPDLLAVPNAINVLWTLSYEMAFYLLVVAVFVTGASRRSAQVAIGLVVLALVAGGLLPAAVLSRSMGVGTVACMCAVALAVAVVAATSDHLHWRVAGGVLGGLLAGVLVMVNSRIEAWEGLVVLAVMFTGTAVHHAEHRLIARRTAVLAIGVVLAGAVVTGAWNLRAGPQAWHTQLVWSGAVLMAAATFAVAWALRRHRFPRWATGLGTVSFSLYLLHPLLLMASDQFLGPVGHPNPAALGVFMVTLLAVSWASQRWIEAPSQRLGRRFSRPTVQRSESRPPKVLVP